MRTTLELPDPLFARLKARAAMERVTLKQLLRAYVEQGLAAEAVAVPPRRVADLPRIAGPESHLAVLAMAQGWRLVTFDRGFGRFDGLVWLEP